MNTKKLWLSLAAVCAVSFAVLGYYGIQIYRHAPPIPERVVTTEGRVLFTGQDIRDGQNAWQAMGGQEVGSIWGHGGYSAPDWTADWLHRESIWLLDHWAKNAGGENFATLSAEQQAQLKVRLQKKLRRNDYNAASGELVLPPERVAAMQAVAQHYQGLFGHAPDLDDLRESYAMPPDSVLAERLPLLTDFLFWATWSTVALRPGELVSYTNNWPPEPLVANYPGGPLVFWTGVSVVGLLIGIALMAGHLAKNSDKPDPELVPETELPDKDPSLALPSTPSMAATAKYFWVAMALFAIQMLCGVVAAHYGVEGDGFYGIALAQWVPFSLARTWHLQLGILWIAVTWLATGLYVAPALVGKDPKGQTLGVHVLFGALVVVVGGSMLGEALGIHQKLSLTANFWFGHQGYEYVELGRLWQLALFVGLLLWLFLMGRAMAPALRRSDEARPLSMLFFVSCVAIALFWAAGLMWGQQTHLAMAEYWRWWVVHLWVEGFFEVFAAVVSAFLFVRLGLLRAGYASKAVLLSTVIFLGGGILGTFHHLYFTGTPVGVLAIGATFSALEVVPLVLIGFEAFRHLRLVRSKPWVKMYRWPVYFLFAASFWNLLGAGVFGFVINPPLALYYMQGLNTTPLHGHAALFGVYGMLGIALMLFCFRGMDRKAPWAERPLAIAFWCLNAGLLAMCLFSLLPVGILQTLASIEHGLWYARSAEFLQSDTLVVLRWMRVPGDSIFAVGVLTLIWFIWKRKAAEPSDAMQYEGSC